MAKPGETFAVGDSVVWDEGQKTRSDTLVVQGFTQEYGRGPFTIEHARDESGSGQMVRLRLRDGFVQSFNGKWVTHTPH